MEVNTYDQFVTTKLDVINFGKGVKDGKGKMVLVVDSELKKQWE